MKATIWINRENEQFWLALGVNDEPISDTQRYKMCGNAVTTNVIQAIFERILS